MSPQAKRKAQEPEPEAELVKPPTTPESESWHRTVLALVVYLCMLVLLVTGIPRVQALFTPGSSMSNAPMPIEKLGDVLSSIVKVTPSPDSYSYSYSLGSSWYSFLAPIVLLLGVQLMIKDKALVCRLQYWLVSAMGVALICGCVYLLIEVFSRTSIPGA